MMTKLKVFVVVLPTYLHKCSHKRVLAKRVIFMELEQFFISFYVANLHISQMTYQHYIGISERESLNFPKT